MSDTTGKDLSVLSKSGAGVPTLDAMSEITFEETRTELDALAGEAVEQVRRWLQRTQAVGAEPHKAAKTLSAVLSHPTGLTSPSGSWTA